MASFGRSLRSRASSISTLVDVRLATAIAESGRALFDAPFVFVTRVDAEARQIHTVGVAGRGSEVVTRGLAMVQRVLPGWDPLGSVFPIDSNPLIQDTYLRGETVLAPLVAVVQGGGVPDIVIEVADRVVGLRHTLTAPLVVSERIVGAVSFMSTRVITAEEEERARDFAAAASRALRTAELLRYLSRPDGANAASDPRTGDISLELLEARLRTRHIVAWLEECEQLLGAELTRVEAELAFELVRAELGDEAEVVPAAATVPIQPPRG